MSTRSSIVRCSSSVIVKTKVVFWGDNRLKNFESNSVCRGRSILIEKDILIGNVYKEPSDKVNTFLNICSRTCLNCSSRQQLCKRRTNLNKSCSKGDLLVGDQLLVICKCLLGLSITTRLNIFNVKCNITFFGSRFRNTKQNLCLNT